MSEIFVLVPFIIFALVFVSMVLNITKAMKKGSGTKPPQQPTFTKPAASQKVRTITQKPQKQKPLNPKSSVKNSMPKGFSSSLRELNLAGTLEDRNNDWMAKELRAEEAALRKSDFADLGAVHAKACAAEQLRREHSYNCDAYGRDTGEY